VSGMPGLPFLASKDGQTIDLSLLLIHLLMLAMLLAWGTVFVIILARFRKSRHPRADYAGIKTRLAGWAEFGVVLAEAAMLVGISIPFWATRVNAVPGPDQHPFEVRVVAQQYVWNVHYPGPDGKFGRTRIELVDDKAGNPIGLDRDDPNAKDDVIAENQLHVPVNRPVIVHLTSKDVIHSFALPELRVKRDAIPGMTVDVPFTPTVTTAQFRDSLRTEANRTYAGRADALAEQMASIDARNYEIACAQMCGLAHYRMRGTLVVETEDELQKWLAAQSTKTGAAVETW
jgi:cytochrome c oxidase subunit 2